MCRILVLIASKRLTRQSNPSKAPHPPMGNHGGSGSLPIAATISYDSGPLVNLRASVVKKGSGNTEPQRKES